MLHIANALKGTNTKFTYTYTLIHPFVCLHAYMTKQLFSMVIQNSNNKEYPKMTARESEREKEREYERLT